LHPKQKENGRAQPHRRVYEADKSEQPDHSSTVGKPVGDAKCRFRQGTAARYSILDTRRLSLETSVVLFNSVLGGLALLSLGLTLWQWFAGRRFPLHRRAIASGPAPSITVLKPLKGCDGSTEACLRSWLVQDYGGSMQIIFGVASADDPVCAVVRKLLTEFPQADAELVVCESLSGANLKVAKLMQLERRAKHDVLAISDADVSVPPDLLANAVVPMTGIEIGLVNCFYRLANPTTLGMHWEAVAINADFWSQVLQAQMLKPLDFALGAVMITRRQLLADIGGFAALVDSLADDYLLGNRIARRGHRIALSTVVVECWDPPVNWAQVWKHQLRWARTIRVCQPVPYFFSLLGNATLWPLLWALAIPGTWSASLLLVCLGVRVGAALDLKARLEQKRAQFGLCWLVPLKDLLQTCLWGLAFLGNRVEWRGQKLRLRSDGTLVRT
jgi:ceramide glucosyltransferase